MEPWKAVRDWEQTEGQNSRSDDVGMHPSSPPSSLKICIELFIYQKQIKNKRSALIKDTGSSLPTEGGIISRDNSLFYVRTSTPSATQPDWHCLNHKATPDRKKKQMSENVLGQSFQLAKCLHDSMNTDEHYQLV